MDDEQKERWAEQRIAYLTEKIDRMTPEQMRYQLTRLTQTLVNNCADTGATEWDMDLLLADVLDKHLVRRLLEP